MQKQIIAVFLMGLFSAAPVFAQEKAPESVPAVETAPETSSSSFENSWNWSLGGGFSLGSSASWVNIDCDGCWGHPDVTARYSEAANLLFEGKWTPPRTQWGWGLNFGLSVDSERKAEKVKVNGTEYDGSSNSKLQITTLYANAVYQFGAMYLPFGLNIDAVKFTPADGYAGTSSASGGLGTQVGFGYLFDDHWSLEGLLRVSALKLDTTDADGTKVDYGTGYLAAILVTGRYTF